MQTVQQFNGFSQTRCTAVASDLRLYILLNIALCASEPFSASTFFNLNVGCPKLPREFAIACLYRIQNSLKQARRDMSEGRALSREQAQKVQLALKSLNPSFTHLQAQRACGLSHRSSVPCFSSSTTPADGTLRVRKAHQSSLPTTNESHRVDDPPTSPSTVIQSTNNMTTPPTLVLDLPLSQPTPPPPPSSPMKKRRRFSVLGFEFGEALPLELVFSTDSMDLEPRNACDGAQNSTLTPSDEHERRSRDHLRPSVPVTQNAESRATQQTYTTWTLEKNGRRIDLKQRDYQRVLELLRRL